MMPRKNRKGLQKTPGASQHSTVYLEAMALRKWTKEVEGKLRFLTDLKGIPKASDEKWASGTRAYYTKTLKQLLSRPPRHGEALAARASKIIVDL